MIMLSTTSGRVLTCIEVPIQPPQSHPCREAVVNMVRPPQSLSLPIERPDVQPILYGMVVLKVACCGWLFDFPKPCLDDSPETS